jgi:hypothetical protein
MPRDLVVAVLLVEGSAVLLVADPCAARVLAESGPGFDPARLEQQCAWLPWVMHKGIT